MMTEQDPDEEFNYDTPELDFTDPEEYEAPADDKAELKEIIKELKQANYALDKIIRELLRMRVERKQ